MRCCHAAAAIGVEGRASCHDLGPRSSHDALPSTPSQGPGTWLFAFAMSSNGIWTGGAKSDTWREQRKRLDWNFLCFLQHKRRSGCSLLRLRRRCIWFKRNTIKESAFQRSIADPCGGLGAAECRRATAKWRNGRSSQWKAKSSWRQRETERREKSLPHLPPARRLIDNSLRAYLLLPHVLQ